MSQPAVLVVTGASGAGKTTLVRGLEARKLPGVGCYYFDSIGVPSTEVMDREFGGPEGWQKARTHEWIARLAGGSEAVAVLDGQTRPNVVISAMAQARIGRGGILLVECAVEERHRRLSGPRGQPELATLQMATWAAYLRGQADALALPIIDTTDLTIPAAIEELARCVSRFRGESGGS